MLAAGGAAHDLMLTANNHDNDGGEDSSSMEQGRSSSKLSHTAAVATAPPSWVSDVASIESCLTTIATYTKDLQGMHAQRINSVFGRDLDHREEAIEEKTARVTDLFRQAERLLQRVGMATRHAGGQEATVGANVQRRYEVHVCVDRKNEREENRLL